MGQVSSITLKKAHKHRQKTKNKNELEKIYETFQRTFEETVNLDSVAQRSKT